MEYQERVDLINLEVSTGSMRMPDAQADVVSPLPFTFCCCILFRHTHPLPTSIVHRSETSLILKTGLETKKLHTCWIFRSQAARDSFHKDATDAIQEAHAQALDQVKRQRRISRFSSTSGKDVPSRRTTLNLDLFSASSAAVSASRVRRHTLASGLRDANAPDFPRRTQSSTDLRNAGFSGAAGRRNRSSSAIANIPADSSTPPGLSRSRSMSTGLLSGESQTMSTEMTQAVNIFLRVRPFVTAAEKSHGKKCLEVDGNLAMVQIPARVGDDSADGRAREKAAVYNAVFDENATQYDVYDRVGKEVMGAVFSGYDAAVIAYGHTGAGKTYTMFGEPGNEEKEGLIPRMLGPFFDELSKEGKYEETNVKISFVQVYCNQVMDLLAEDFGIGLFSLQRSRFSSSRERHMQTNARLMRFNPCCSRTKTRCVNTTDQITGRIKSLKVETNPRTGASEIHGAVQVEVLQRKCLALPVVVYMTDPHIHFIFAGANYMCSA